MPKNFTGYIVTACLAAATLGLELVQTRILSALYYNHVVYLTVTIALMGFGVAGVLVSLLSQKLNSIPVAVFYSSAFFALTTIIAIYIVSRLPMWWPNSPVTYKLFFSYLLLIVPFLCSGTALGLIFMQNGARIHRFYAADLAASAAACAAFVLLLNPLGASGFVMACVGLIFIAAALQARKSKISSHIFCGIIAAILLPCLLCSTHLVNNTPEPYKTLGKWMKHPRANIEKTEWTPITRLDIISLPDWSEKDITQDSDAHTTMHPSPAVHSIVERIKKGELPLGAITLGYRMQAAPPEQSLVIGVGGGVDIIASRASGAKQTTGVEINPVTVRLTTKDYKDELVWPHWENVNIVNDEGRHYIRSHENAYDTITMSGIDTFSALNSGAYVLSENYLYTTEAFEDYLKALKPSGIMTINRWFEAIPPRESLRLASLHVEASQRLGIQHPESSIFVVVDNDWASTFIKKTPFTPEEIQRALAAINKTSMRVVYLPKVFPQEQQKLFEFQLANARSPSLNIAANAYEHVINPFFQVEKSQFLEKYPLDVSPVYDDRPFFFEYHKSFSFSDMLKNKQMEQVRMNVKNNLYLLLAVCFLVSTAAIILPLVTFNSQGLKTAGTAPLLLFFSCLGVGFMLVEIGMMQRLSLYLGDPMHSMLVVLSGLLLFAGSGAYLSGSSKLSSNSRFFLGTIGAMFVIIIWIALMPSIILATQESGFMARVCITLLSLLPVGLIMGIPFATGLHYLESYSPRFIPWAWGINGLTSVFASILAIIIAMQIGFTSVLMIGAFMYFIGWRSIRYHQCCVQ